MTGTSVRTREGYTHELAGILRAMGGMGAGRITRPAIERHLLMLEREGRSRRTRAGLVILLRSIFEYALREGLIWRSPVEHLKVPRGARGGRRPQVLTPEQLRAFLTAASRDTHAAYWVLAVGPGARPQELAGLEWRHVDLERGEVHIKQALTRAGGKLLIGPTKTGKERTVPIASTVVDALRAHRAWQAARALRSGIRGWLNQHSAVLEPDGTVKVIVAERDPGHPNWLATATQAHGTIGARWVGNGVAEVVPSVRVVRLSNAPPAAQQQ